MSNKKAPRSGGHLRKIKKGKLGKFSKVREEYNELRDAIEQENDEMIQEELCDLYNALNQYCWKKYKDSIQGLYIEKRI